MFEALMCCVGMFEALVCCVGMFVAPVCCVGMVLLFMVILRISWVHDCNQCINPVTYVYIYLCVFLVLVVAKWQHLLALSTSNAQQEEGVSHPDVPC